MIDLATLWRANHRPCKDHSEARVRRVLVDSTPTHKEAEATKRAPSPLLGTPALLRVNPARAEPIQTGQGNRHSLFRGQDQGGQACTCG